jgi:hypothetical protein
MFRVLALLFATIPSAHAVKIDPAVLQATVIGRAGWVQEFRGIRDQAKTAGVRVWLLGRTAAAYAYYVMWSLQKEQRDPHFKDRYFDFIYSDIFSANHRFELVVQGDGAAFHKFQDTLHLTFKYLDADSVVPNNAVIIVRPLAEVEKEFAETGKRFDPFAGSLIELSGGRDVRDLGDEANAGKVPTFLLEVTGGRTIRSTAKSMAVAHADVAKLDLAPAKSVEKLPFEDEPIVRTVRYLVSIFKANLKISKERLAELKTEISAVDPEAVRKNEGVRDWLLKNGPELRTDAVDQAYSQEVLAEIGLSRKLISISNSTEFGSLGWWLSDEVSPDDCEDLLIRRRYGNAKTKL